MPITFHTKSYADITFLTDVGKQLIALMGHTPSVPGAIVASDLPAALARLRSGLVEIPSDNQPEEDARADDAERPVSLAQRALPLIQLIEAAVAEKENVMWD
jgi:hypothetical protein